MKKITVKELEEKLLRLSSGIKSVVNATKYDVYNDWSCIKDFDDITDPDELQLLDDYERVMKHICDIHYTLLYYQREVIGEYTLSMNSRGYFEDDLHEYHCGDIKE